MAYTELQDTTDLTLKGIMQYPSLETGMFYPVILFVIFTVVTLLSFFRELRREGRGNFLSSLAVGGFVTQMIAVIFTFMELISYQVMVLVLVIGVVFQVIFLLTNKD